MAGAQETNLAAVLQSPKARITVTARPIPVPGEQELLVRNHAVAVNPVDWKIQDYDILLDKYPNVLGSDVSGVVVAVGSGVTHFEVGDRVCGFAAVIYNSKIDHGAFQTYTILREIATTKIPASLSFVEASVFPMAAATAAAGLFDNLGLPRPTANIPEGNDNSALLVWGASSAVGTMVVQFAKALGLTVLATASPAHHEYIKTLGATEVFNYKDPAVVSNLVSAAKRLDLPISLCYDAISEGNTKSLSISVLAASGGPDSKLACVFEVPDDEPQPNNITTTLIHAWDLGTAKSELGAWFFNEWLKDALEKKTVVPSPKIEVLKGGIAATQKAFDLHKAGVSGKKYVLEIE